MQNIDQYYILMDCGAEDSAVVVQLPDGSLDERDVNRGKLLSDLVPEKLKLTFSKTFYDKIKLYDFVSNTMSFLIISDRLKILFEAEGIENIEYLPVEIFDLQNNIAGPDYHLINFLKHEPIIDMNKSECDMSFFDSTMISDVHLLHLDIQNVDPHAKLFRATNEQRLNFISKDLLEKMIDSDITGIRAIKAQGWDGNELIDTDNILT